MSQTKERVSALWHSNKNWLILSVICASVVAVTYFTLFDHYANFGFQKDDFIYKVESKLFDWKMTQRETVETSGKVGILAIDDKAVKAFGSWPLKRRYYKQVLDNLKKAGVPSLGGG